MILVTGATGNVGGHLIRIVCQTGAPVRALVRSPERADTLRGYDCEIAIGDFADAGSLAAALRDVDRVFLISPAGPTQAAQEGNVVRAVRDHAPAAHVVKVAVIGVERRPSGSRILTAHQEVIDQLAASGLRHTVLAPNAFMQNLIRQAAAIQHGAIYSTTGEAEISHVDTRDVAAVAAHVLLSEGHVGATYTLTGPQALTYAEIAEHLSAATGREVRHHDISEDESRVGMLAAGVPPWIVEALIEFNHVAGAVGAVITDEVTKATGRPAYSIDAFLAAHRAAFA